MAGAASSHIGIVLSEEKNKHKNRFNYIFVASAAVIALYIILLPFHFKRYWVLYQEYKYPTRFYSAFICHQSCCWLRHLTGCVCVCLFLWLAFLCLQSTEWTDVWLIDRTYYEKCIIKWNTIRLFWTNGQFSMPFISNSSRTKLVRYTCVSSIYIHNLMVGHECIW